MLSHQLQQFASSLDVDQSCFHRILSARQALAKRRPQAAIKLLPALLVLLCYAPASLTWAAFPASETIASTATTPVTWVGTATGPASASTATACREGIDCDTFFLTFSGKPSDWTGKIARITINWQRPMTDYDLYILRDIPGGAQFVIAQSTNHPPNSLDTHEVIDFNPDFYGTGKYLVRVMYTSASLADQYNGSIAVIPTENSCRLPGLTVLEDQRGDAIAAQSSHDIERVSIAEPYLVGASKLFFTIKTADLKSLTPNTFWRVYFRTQNSVGPRYFVDMRTGDMSLPNSPAAQSVSYKYGLGDGTTLGDADEGHYNPETGTITITISPGKIGNPQPDQSPAHELEQIYAQVVFAGHLVDSAPNRGFELSPAKYAVVGNAACTPGQIAFMSTRDGNQEVYKMAADGSNQVNLSNHPATEYTPSWSPDGRKITFTSSRAGDHDIFAMNPDGGNLINLTNLPDSDLDPAWSPDGKKIAFDLWQVTGTYPGIAQIYVMDANGSNRVRLTQDSSFYRSPTWSPDGKKLAFWGGPQPFQIFVMNADGTGMKQLTDGGSENLYAAWSPDGTRIAFSSNRDGNYEIYVMNADGSNVKRLTNATADDTTPAWSPDGSCIAFMSGRHINAEIYVMNADGSNQTRLTDTRGNFTPSWQPAVEYSLSLNGSNAYMEAPNSASLNLTGPFTIEAWIKTNSASVTQSIIERWGPSPNSDGGYALRLLGGKLQLFSVRNSGDYDVITGSTNVTTDTWHHVAGVFDGSQLRIYLDGILDNSKASTFAPASGTQSIKFGQSGSFDTFHFDGLIDEARVTAGAVYTSNFIPQTDLSAIPGVRGLWKFDNQMTSDFSGSGNHGTLVNWARYSTDVPLTSSNSISLNGTSAYVEVPNAESLNITGPVTVEAWIKPSASTPDQGIVERYGASPAANGGYALRIADGKLRFFTLKNDSVGDWVDSSTPVSTGVWHHVAGVFDGSQLRVYLDGKLDGAKSSSFAPVSGTNNLRIGQSGTDAPYWFKGLIDEARVTAGVVYTGDFTPRTHLTPEAATRGLWKFDGQSTRDSSGNRNHGMLIGGAIFSADTPTGVSLQPTTTVENVVWTNAVNVGVNGNNLTKSGINSAWDAGAASTKAIASGDGYVEFTVGEANTHKMCGLSFGDAGQGFEDIDFAIYPNYTGDIFIYEAGANRENHGTYQPGDRLRVAVEGGVIKYRKNGVLLYTSTIAPVYPLRVDTTLWSPGASINGVIIAGTLQTASDGPPFTGYRASTDFSGVQGQRNWYYLDSTGAQMTFNAAGNQWKSTDATNVLYSTGGQPGENTDAVRQWRAPSAGTIRITGSASDAQSGCGEGVIVLIKKGAQVLWQQTIENGNNTGFSYDLTTTVTAGDPISFVINRRVNNHCDATNFDPTIIYTSGG